MIAIITILRQNYLMNRGAIFNGQTVDELVNECYSYLASKTSEYIKDRTQMPSDALKEKIGALFYTKKINPPSFFSWSFVIGVYLPLLAPFLFPPIQTIQQLVQLKLAKKFKKKPAENAS